MNRIERTGALFTLLMILMMHAASGQGISKKRDYSGFFDSYFYRGPLSITVGAGTSLYKGDMAKGFYGTPGGAFSVGLNYKVWPRTIFGAEFQYLSLAGKSGDAIGSSFTGTDMGVNLYGRLYLIDDIVRSSHDRMTNKKVKIYLTGGVGFIKYRASGTLGSASSTTPVFPVGLGLEYKVSPKLQILPEFTQTFTLNDYIDGAAVKKGKDGYGIFMLKIQYSPFAPKKKKKIKLSPADPNLHREEHQEWRKKKEEPKPPVEEEQPKEEENKDGENPDGEQKDGEQKNEGTEDTPKEDGTQENKNTEEKPNGE